MGSRFPRLSPTFAFLIVIAYVRPVFGATQTITFDPIPNQIFGSSPFTVAAQASSGLPVGFVSTTRSVCRNSGDLVILLSAGTCSITASQPGNIGYSAATPVARSFAVSLAKPSSSLAPGANSAFAVGMAPRAVAVGDFNGDGIQDLAVANFLHRNLTVLLGDGLGGFTPAPGGPFRVDHGPQSVAVGDFNGDGFQDLVVANQLSDSLTVLLGDGKGGFTATAGGSLTGVLSAHAVAVGDFNGDGIQDLAAADLNQNTVTVLLGDGTGNFTPATGSPFAAGGDPYSLVVGDFNGDGVQDLAVGNFYSNDVTVLLGNGAGGFNAATGSPFAVGTAPESLAIGDFNRDGVQDLAVANYKDNTVTVLLGIGSGGFTAARGNPFTVGTGPESVVTGDFNGDGIPDLATANFWDDDVTVLLGNGSGGFTLVTSSQFTVGTGPVFVATGDFNGDGVPDFATANNTDDDATVLLSFLAGHTPQTISFGALNNVTYGGAPFAIGAMATSGLTAGFASTTPSVCTIAVKTVTIVAGGSCSIIASQTGSAIYAAATPITQSFTVNPAVQTIAFSSLSNVVFGAAPFTVSASSSSGLPVSFFSGTTAVCTVAGATVTITGGGNCSITASQLGNADYAATSVVQGFTVTPTTQAITFASLNSVAFGIAPFTIPATASSRLTVSFSSSTTAVCTVSAAIVTIAGVGTCSITASQTGNASYFAATSVTQVFTVTQGAQTISFRGLNNLTFGAGPFSVFATASSGLTVNFSSGTTSVCAVIGATLAIGGVGTCSITASQPGNVNYLAATPVTQSFSVAQATQTITFGTLNNVAFGVAPFTISAIASSGLTVSLSSSTAAVCNVSGVTVTIVTLGQCAITASQPGNGNYLAAPPITQSFTIAHATQSITFSPPGNVPAGTVSFSLNASASSGLSVSFASLTPAVCSVSGATVTIVASGTCSISASQTGNANYAAATSVTQSLTVGVKPSEAGVFRQNFLFALDSANARNGIASKVYLNFVTPMTGDMPVVGDWSGSGNSKIGIYRPTTGTWFLDYNGDGVYEPGIDKTYQFGGLPGDVPVTGDWTGSGVARVGLVRPFVAGGTPALWILDITGNGVIDSNTQVFAFGGIAGDVPVVGDWTGNGITKVGMVRPFAPGGTPALWILDANNDHVIGTGDLIFAFGGITGDVPVIGDWNGSGFSKVGVYRQGFLWVVDNNGSAPTVLGSSQVVAFPFGGIAGDVPLVGKW